jgi:acid stress chaperone HdeB
VAAVRRIIGSICLPIADALCVAATEQPMKRASSIVISALLAASAAQAQTTIDVAKISCEQFVLMKVAPPDYLAIWLSGYYSGRNNNTTIDVQRLKDNAQKVKHYCLYNKGMLMEAVEKVLSPSP